MDSTAALAVEAMRTLYPEWLADSAWDNTGLLLANTQSPSSRTERVVLLANDLTPRVVDEAIHQRASIVIAYHPFIFRGLKSITLKDPQQVSLIRLAQNNIAVYSPHTALDAAPGGINDWLADAVISSFPSGGAVTHALKPVSGSGAQQAPVQPDVPQHRDSSGALVTGYGRFVALTEPVEARSLIREILWHLRLIKNRSSVSTLRHVLVARPRMSSSLASAPDDDNAPPTVQTVAICAGSGADILRGAPADLYLTGEMSHHDALAATVQGKWVVCLLHSNSERLFLEQRLQSQLARELAKASTDPVSVLVSEADHDPFEIWDVSA